MTNKLTVEALALALALFSGPALAQDGVTILRGTTASESTPVPLGYYVPPVIHREFVPYDRAPAAASGGVPLCAAPYRMTERDGCRR